MPKDDAAQKGARHNNLLIRNLPLRQTGNFQSIPSRSQNRTAGPRAPGQRKP